MARERLSFVSMKTNKEDVMMRRMARCWLGKATGIPFFILPSLVNTLDGLSPLQILAAKPNCFKSSTRMELLQSIIYKCSIVDEIEETYDIRCNEADTTHHYPMNYETCATFLSLLKSTSIGKDDNAASNDEENNVSRKSEEEQAKKLEKKRYLFPPNWGATIRFLTHMMKILLIICGFGASWIGKIQRKKVKHILAKQVMNELIQRTCSSSLYKHDHTGTSNINSSTSSNNQSKEKGGFQKIRRTDSPILIAAKMGVAEMVEKILETDPVAIHDVDADNKNVVLLAIENRQPHVYSLLNERSMIKETAFRQVDNQGNSALHLAATYRSYKPWRVPGAALQMQWEYKWYKVNILSSQQFYKRVLVKNSMPPNFYERYNENGQTAKQVFISTHERLTKEGGKWLSKTSESCSLVAALVATVAFTTSTAVPGGPNQNTGYPLFQGRLAFNIFAVASLVALCSSVTALVLFLSILTSRFQEKDFAMDLPRKLLLGLTTLFTSIASVLVSFCAGHFFIVEDELKFAVYPIYVATCLPVSFFAFVQLPLYFDLSLAMIRKVPQRSYKSHHH
ncbi:hypothetical protein GLYMA_13G213800v4 [Glycine max]|nr:hypothetical protein GLYMA_13G213800v4 [Glycine max]KAH1102635.1 hypothetical protein GYH30_036929 [Glycine max]